MSTHVSHTLPRGFWESRKESQQDSKRESKRESSKRSEAQTEKTSYRESAVVEALREALREAELEAGSEAEREVELEVELEAGSEAEREAELEALLKAGSETAACKKTAKPAEASSTASFWKELRILGAKLGALVLVSLLLLSFVFGLHYNVDADMYPAIKDGDLIMYNRWSKDFHAGDLAVLSFQDQTQVRRVVAVAGDTVDIVRGGLMINGALIQEHEIYESTQRYVGGIDFPITLQDNEIFVLGDARGGATDSRIYGLVQVDDTRGTVMTLFRRRGL